MASVFKAFVKNLAKNPPDDESIFAALDYIRQMVAGILDENKAA